MISSTRNQECNTCVHYAIECIEDLPSKLGLIDVTMRMLSHEDPDYGGFKRLFEDFYEEVRKAIVLKDDQHENRAVA